MIIKFFSPFIQLLLLIAVSVLTFWLLTTTEDLIGLHDLLWRIGIIDLVVELLIVGAIIFSLGNHFLLKAEKISRPSIGDHFRHTTLLYIIAVIGTFLFLSIMHEEFISPGVVLWIIPTGAAYLGIIINMLFLLPLNGKREVGREIVK